MSPYIKTASVLLCAAVLSGCMNTKTQVTPPIYGPEIQVSATPYSKMLSCLGKRVGEQDKLVIAVDRIPDKTGQFSSYGDGYKVTQGAEDMVISAFGKTNAFKLVERTKLNIPLFEVQYANEYLLSDNNPAENITRNGRYARAIHSGVFLGSDYVVTGSISEINYNLGTGGFGLYIDGIGGGWREFSMDVAMDLRVINTQTTEIVMTLPIRKQIWGYENEAGVVRFFGDTFTDFQAGMVKEEPIQLAVRSIIEGAVADITRTLYHLPERACRLVVRNYYTESRNSNYEYSDDLPARTRNKAVQKRRVHSASQCKLNSNFFGN